MRTLKALFNYVGYSLTPNNEISTKNEKKELSQDYHPSNSLSTTKIESQNIYQKMKELKEKQSNETSKDKNESTMNQIIESFKQFQTEIFDSQSSKYLEKIDEIGQSQLNKFNKVLMHKFYTLKEINNEKLNKNSQNIQRLIDEFNIMLTLHHPNILKVHGQFINDENQQNPSILLEYCPFNLEQKIKKEELSKVQQVYWIYQIAEGMKYVHLHNIIHNNLKPSNILISKRGIIKIADFNKAQLNEINSKTEEMEDVYAFGSIVYFILSGGKNKKSHNEKVLKKLPLLARKLINACWSAQPEHRPTFDMICDDLEKNYFNLISLSQQETKEAQKLINEHKSLISRDSEL